MQFYKAVTDFLDKIVFRKEDKKFIKMAIEEARVGINNTEGGPFGAVIVKNGRVLSVAHNEVLKNNDPTSHAEMLAIKRAGKKLETHNLTGCTLYTTSEPCPMCLGAIYWANIKSVYYGTNKSDVDKIGFRDEKFYKNFDEHSHEENLSIKCIERLDCLDLLHDWNEFYDKHLY